MVIEGKVVISNISITFRNFENKKISQGIDEIQ